jgi:hypothetical protein
MQEVTRVDVARLYYDSIDGSPTQLFGDDTPPNDEEVFFAVYVRRAGWDGDFPGLAGHVGDYHDLGYAKEIAGTLAKGYGVEMLLDFCEDDLTQEDGGISA